MDITFPPGPASENWLEDFNRDRLQFCVELTRQYGELVHLPIGKKRHLYIVSSPEFMRYVLIEHPEQFSRGTIFKRRASKLVGTGLLTSEGEFNKRQRRLMQPAFHRSQIAGYADLMVQAALEVCRDWQPGEVRDIHHDMMRLTMTVVARALFGADISADVDEIGRAVTAGVEYLNDESMAEPREAIQVLNNLIAQLVAQHRASAQVGQGQNLLSLLLAAHDDQDDTVMTDEQLNDEIITLFIAGHETSANVLSFAWYLLANYPEVEQRLHTELGLVLAGRDPALADVPRLPYTEQVIKETLRLFPVAWNQSREVLTDVQFGGFTIPKGSSLLLSPYLVQRNPRYFSNPECFDPERFSPANESQIARGAYQPFSAGPRVCIGQPFAMLEMVLALAALAQRWRLLLPEGYKLEIEPLIALRPRGGLPMQIEPR